MACAGLHDEIVDLPTSNYSEEIVTLCDRLDVTLERCATVDG